MAFGESFIWFVYCYYPKTLLSKQLAPSFSRLGYSMRQLMSGYSILITDEEKLLCG